MTEEKRKIIKIERKLDNIKCWIMRKVFLEENIKYRVRKLEELSKHEILTMKIGESSLEYKERLEYEKIVLESMNRKKTTSILLPFAGLLTALIAICNFSASISANLLSILVEVSTMLDKVNAVSLEEQKEHIESFVSSIKINTDFASWAINWLMNYWGWIVIAFVTLTALDYMIIDSKNKERKIIIDLINLKLRKLEEIES